jgi:hypothetical protein
MSAVAALIVLVIGFLLGAGASGLIVAVGFVLAALSGVRATGG